MTEKHLDIAIRCAKHNGFKIEAQKKLQAKWEAGFKQFHDARELIYCALVSIQYRFISKNENLKPDKVDLTLTINSFFKGVELTEFAICRGFYAQANNLLKQEMETLCACIEIRNGKRKDKKTPNTQNLPYGLRSVYGHLNNVAHVSHSASLKFVNLAEAQGNSTSASSSPQYNEKIAKGLYGLHIVFMHEIALEMIQGYAATVKASDIKEELEILRKGFGLLEKLKVLS